jgi:fatty acid desaturase
LRQLLGSANITGGKLFHVMSGNLSHQIEHHLFPDIPARRYPHIAPEVRALCEKYGLQYNSGRLSKQLLSVAKQLVQFAKPPKDPAKWHRKYKKSDAHGRTDQVLAPEVAA